MEEGDALERLGLEMTEYDEARLARLLSCLRPAPKSSVEAAQRLPAVRVALDSMVAAANHVAVLTDDVPEERAVRAVVLRQQVVDALDMDDGAELWLELVQSSEDGHEEHATVSLGWSKNELGRLLQGIASDQVVLTLDREQLAQAFADVEAHALPEQPVSVAVRPADGADADEAGARAALAITAAEFTARRSRRSGAASRSEVAPVFCAEIVPPRRPS